MDTEEQKHVHPRYTHAKRYPLGPVSYVIIGNDPLDNFNVYFEIVNDTTQRRARCTHADAFNILTSRIIEGAIDFLYRSLSDIQVASFEFDPLIVPKKTYSSSLTPWQFFFIDTKRKTEVCIDDEMWRHLKKLAPVLRAQIKYNLSLQQNSDFHYNDVVQTIAREVKKNNVKLHCYNRERVVTEMYLNEVDKLEYKEQVMLLEILTFCKGHVMWDFGTHYEKVWVPHCKKFS